MVCLEPRPYYTPHSGSGIVTAVSRGDGYSVAVEWTQAYPRVETNLIGYNLYYSTIHTDVFTEGVKFVSIDADGLAATIYELTPGDTYYFAVRAFEYDSSIYDLTMLPNSGFPDLKVYPESMLLANMDDTQTTMEISDIEQWPDFGVLQIGYEIIRYSSKDILNSLLLGLTRGYANTNVRLHQTNGYDGYLTHEPFVKFWKGYEEPNNVIATAYNQFQDRNFPFTQADGYRERVDNLTTDLSGSDANMADFPVLDHAGYRRDDLAALLRGDCLGTYYGGEQFCADGYGVGQQVRGVPLADEVARREEALLELTGETVVLVKRLWSGINCSCFEPFNEHPQLRCRNCFGTGFVTGYQQFFNPRRSDGRILVRFNPAEDDVILEDHGMESTLISLECTTIVFPAVKDRDFIIRFNEDGTEEFRYEILSVTRNKLLFGTSGGQKFKAVRVRKTDPIYMWKYISSTATLPSTITTSIAFLPGPNNTQIPHTHTVTINESVTSLSQINQTTSWSAGHNHIVKNGVVLDNHLHPNSTHTLII